MQRKGLWMGLGVMAFAISGALVPTLAQDTTSITLQDTALRPQSIAYNPATNDLLVGSLAQGGVYEVSLDGTTKSFVEDATLVSTTAVYVDSANNRLLAISSGIGKMLGNFPAGGGPGQPNGQPPAGGAGQPNGQPPAGGAGQPNGQPPAGGAGQPNGQPPAGFEMPDFTLKLAAFDLTTKAKTLEVDLTNIAPQGARFATGIAVDKDGVIYVTDSLAAAIYRIDTSGQAQYLSDPKFGTQMQMGQGTPQQGTPAQGNPPQGAGGQGRMMGAGGGLSGIVYSADGYLLAIESTSGSLLKIPLDNPSNIQTVTLPQPLTGAGGLALQADGKLIVTNGSDGKVYVLSSSDAWATAAIAKTVDAATGIGSATTNTSSIYVLSSGFGTVPASDNTGASILVLPLQ